MATKNVSEEPHILIIGAGITGLVLAQALKKVLLYSREALHKEVVLILHRKAFVTQYSRKMPHSMCVAMSGQWPFTGH
ncbi:hypothetical protein ACMFMG_005279 [Clarireedia jacksonii]